MGAAVCKCLEGDEKARKKTIVDNLKEDNTSGKYQPFDKKSGSALANAGEQQRTATGVRRLSEFLATDAADAAAVAQPTRASSAGKSRKCLIQ